MSLINHSKDFNKPLNIFNHREQSGLESIVGLDSFFKLFSKIFISFISLINAVFLGHIITVYVFLGNDSHIINFIELNQPIKIKMTTHLPAI